MALYLLLAGVMGRLLAALPVSFMRDLRRHALDSLYRTCNEPSARKIFLEDAADPVVSDEEVARRLINHLELFKIDFSSNRARALRLEVCQVRSKWT